jgi:Flp pilus assembly CpaE family ATPase
VGVAAAPTLHDIDTALHEVDTSPGVWPTGAWPTAVGSAPEPEQTDAVTGRLIAVWGPAGAPGRTTIAIGLADALASSGVRACLVDLDTYAPSVTLALGIVEDAAGIVVACRHAEAGSLTAATLGAARRPVRARLDVIGGLPHPERWAELRPGALDRIWDAGRQAGEWTVVDVGFCIEDDDSALGRRRNAAARSALAAADLVLAVADASGPGAARLIAAWPQLRAATTAPVQVVRNRAVDRDRDWPALLRAGGVDAPVVSDVPDDRRALADCWRQGRCVSEAAPRSRVRRAMSTLARGVMSP